MKHFYIRSSFLLLAGLLFSFAVVSQEISILNGKIELLPGETIELLAEYTDSTGLVDVDIKWHTDPGYLGKVDKDDIFTAGHPGEGMLYAKYRSLRDSVEVVIEGESKGDDEDNEEAEVDYPKVKVVPGKIKIAAGDSVELVAFYINEVDEKVDTTFSWEVLPDGLGSFPDSTTNKFFAADTTGEGHIVARLGELADTVKLVVEEPKTWPNKGNNSRRITITPGDTTVNAEELGQIQYTAEYKTNGNKHENADLIWSISGDSIGTIDEMTGLLTLSGNTGLALVKAEYSNFSASVELLVLDSTADTEVNQITIQRVLPDGNALPPKTFDEGESYNIGGLPFPLNILNGGMIHFPFGCIDEDIVIYMFIPEEYAEVDDSTAEVSFEQEIITGVKFSVKPADSTDIVEPYYFNIPLNLSIVYKHELLDSLGVSPEELDVFFADNTGFVSEGTANVTVDTVKNKIYAGIEHFSTLVVKPKSAQTPAIIQNETTDLLTVYPNPFSESAKISFELSEPSQIHLAIYNIFGQQVNTLVSGQLPGGAHILTWNGTDQNGQFLSPGIYLCRMIKNGGQIKVKRLILNR